METRNVRGTIYDRNMLPLTDAETGLSVAITSEILARHPEFTVELLRTLDIDSEELNDIMRGSGVQLIPLKTIDQAFIDASVNAGTRIITTDRRYSSNNIATHLIGYSPHADYTAGFGLERAFNDILSGEVQRVGIIRDFERGFPLSNIGQTANFDDIGGLRTTIDFHIQQAAETVMDAMVERGAVIVSDVRSGDILAMASRGNFSQNNLRDHFESDDGELLNRAVIAFDAGSIFKIVTAAAAFEQGLTEVDTMFRCGGYLTIDGRQFFCLARYGHGNITFEQAFAYSCNVVFYHLGMELGFDLLNEYSRRFGLGELVLNLENFGEQAGVLPARQFLSNSKFANMSIGQGDTLLTPLQVTNMVNIIANNGILRQLNIADASVDRFGNIRESFINNHSERVIQEDTARKIRQLMDAVVDYGTGTNAITENFTAGGKTSSAETGWMENGEFKVHAWFAGYAPSDEPRFVITVFVQNGRRGSAVAAPVFREIAERLFVLGR